MWVNPWKDAKGKSKSPQQSGNQTRREENGRVQKTGDSTSCSNWKKTDRMRPVFSLLYNIYHSFKKYIYIYIHTFNQVTEKERHFGVINIAPTYIIKI